MIRPPRRIVVIGQPFDVTVVPRDVAMYNGADPHCLGMTDVHEAFIQLRAIGAGGQSPMSQLDTMLHESLHAVFYASGTFGAVFDKDHTKEEPAVGLMAPAILDLLRKNPVLVRYLTQKLP